MSVADARAEAAVAAARRADQLIVPFEHLAVDESVGAEVPFAPTYSRWLTPRGLNAFGCLGWTAFQRGRLRTAQALCDEGLELARSQGWMERPQAALVTLVLAMVHLERTRHVEAERLLDAPCHAHRVDRDSTYVAVQLARARVLVAAGRVSQATSVVAELRNVCWPLPATVSQWLTLVEAELDLARGEPDAVSRRARAHAKAEGGSSDRVRVVTARAELAQGHLAEVDTILADVRGRSRNPVACAEAWLVTALAADRRRHDHEAMTALDHALALAEPEDLRRPFLAFGDRVEPMLRHRQRLTPDLSEFVTGLQAEFDTTEHAPSNYALPSDPLTDRENMVLRHMATLQTNEDIAADLSISVNTVKAHAKSVYRKLAISNRREAVERGRILRLI
jgi:LuxR family maltose regulon positive regulatory protein